MVRKYVQELYEDHEYFMKVSMKRRSSLLSTNDIVQSWLPHARRCFQRGSPLDDDHRSSRVASGESTTPGYHLQKASPFGSMKSVQTSCPSKTASTGSATTIQQDIYAERQHTKGVKSFLSVPITAYKSGTVDVPPYTTYVSLKQNVLAENNKQLLYWPYFGEDQNENKKKPGLGKELNERFDVVYEQRPHRMLRTEQSHKFGPYVDAILDELGCDYGAVLRYLLDPEPSLELGLEMSNLEMRLWKSRDDSCRESFDRTKKRWVLVLSGLPPTPDSELALAGLACNAFLNVCGFSIWHIAKWSELAQLPTDRSARYSGAVYHTLMTDLGTPYRALACRVCHV